MPLCGIPVHHHAVDAERDRDRLALVSLKVFPVICEMHQLSYRAFSQYRVFRDSFHEDRLPLIIHQGPGRTVPRKNEPRAFAPASLALIAAVAACPCRKAAAFVQAQAAAFLYGRVARSLRGKSGSGHAPSAHPDPPLNASCLAQYDKLWHCPSVKRYFTRLFPSPGHLPCISNVFEALSIRSVNHLGSSLFFQVMMSTFRFFFHHVFTLPCSFCTKSSKIKKLADMR